MAVGDWTGFDRVNVQINNRVNKALKEIGVITDLSLIHI